MTLYKNYIIITFHSFHLYIDFVYRLSYQTTFKIPSLNDVL